MDRFWEKVNRGDENACWPWLGAKRNGGYGAFWLRGKLELAHRVAWELASGRSVGEGKVIMHACDSRTCCNPTHLQEGTQSENLQDMVRKGRKSDQAGSKHPRTDLIDDDIREIRALAARGVKRVRIALQFRTTRAAVDSIVQGKTWAHVL